MRRVALAGTLLLLAACSTSSTPAATSWRALAPAQLERTEVAAARVGNSIFVIGGFEQSSGETTAAVERYDIARNRWSRGADLPVALNHAAAASYRGFVYVAGGYKGRRTLDDEVASLYRYDPVRDRWRELPSMPTVRGALALVALRGRLYAVGGANTTDGALATLEVYDIARRSWSRARPMPTPREHLAAAATAGRVFVLAGRAAGRGNFDVVEAYDPARRRWSTHPPMRKPRGGIAAAVARGRIVVVGGEEGAGTIGEVEAYDPARRRWSRLPDMRTPRHGLGAVAKGRRVYAIEGGDQPGFHFTNALEALDA